MGIVDWFLGRLSGTGSAEPEPALSEDAVVQLIVGLGNPGAEHEHDRHNAGFRFVDELARRHGGNFRPDKKFHGEVARVTIDGHELRLLKPQTFMNRSGASVRAVSTYLKVPMDKILVAHDEIDLPVGTVRLKRGGGHGGNNGLRDVIAQLGAGFARLRIGVGHPGEKSKVVGYVLKRAPASEADATERASDEAADLMPLLVSEGFEKAMHKLHTAK
ncbi:MAG: aminoacyl-tRNA hydrolase [Pseudomonadota bacterium]